MSRIVRLGTAVFFLSTIPGVAAPAAGAALLVQPARIDFDRDGRADTAAGVPTRPSVVRVTLSRTGPRDIAQPGAVLAIAGFDYDRDGDIDLLVGTSEGALLWVNDGHGAFSMLLLERSSSSPASSTPPWAGRPALTEVPLDRCDPAIAQHDRAARRHLDALNILADRRDSGACDLRFSPGSPRAPPRS
jgi:hypothetical protein